MLASAVRLARTGHLAEAKALLRQAETRSPAPEIDHAWARVLMVAGERAAAIAHFRRYLRRVPADFRARSSLAAELAADGRLAAARRELAEAVANAPPAKRPLLFNEFGNALVDSRRDDAIRAYTQAVELAPDHAQMRLNLASALSLAGQQPAAIYHIALAQALDPALLDADEPTYLESQLLALLARAEDPVTQRHHASRLAAMRTKGTERLPSPVPRDTATTRLRVGYVSPDFRRHAVATFFAPVLAAHDRAQVETFLYGEVPAPDAVTERLQGMADHWLTTCDLTTRQLAERIRNDGIDVLVDLAGWTVGSRLDAFACRPAGVQLTWLGYAATTGLDSDTGLDGRLTDGWADPPGETEGHFTERLLRLPSGFIAQRPLDDDAPPPPSRKPDGASIRFGSFNNAAKISSATAALWVAALNAVPGSRLILKNHALNDPYIVRELRDRFVRAGLAVARLELRPSLRAYDDHLRAYDDIDIALDTFPYHGTTTTCEALFRGVPVVTLAGRTHAARVGVSLLSRIGCSDWITASEGAFAAQAAALARDVSRLAELRAQLPQMLRAAPLFDPAAIARDLEALYRQLIAQKVV